MSLDRGKQFSVCSGCRFLCALNHSPQKLHVITNICLILRVRIISSACAKSRRYYYEIIPSFSKKCFFVYLLVCLFLASGQTSFQFAILVSRDLKKQLHTIIMAAVLLPCVNVPVTRKSSTAILKQSFMLALLRVRGSAAGICGLRNTPLVSSYTS